VYFNINISIFQVLFYRKNKNK